MLPEHRPRHGQEDATEEYSFDELVKGMANGTLSRPRALRMAGAALLSAVLLPVLPKSAWADNFHRRCSGKKGAVCRSGRNKVCCPEGSVCAQQLREDGSKGESICVDPASIEWEGDCRPSGVNLCLDGKVCAGCHTAAKMGRGLCAETVLPVRL